MKMTDKLADAVKKMDAAAAAQPAPVKDPEAAETVALPQAAAVTTADNGDVKAESVAAAATASGGFAGATVTVDVSAEDKARFRDIIFSGARFTKPFSLYGGKLEGCFRSRTAAEDMAVWSWARHKLETGAYTLDAEYRTDIRNAVLAATVANINGVDMPELERPYCRETGKDGVVPQGWLWQAREWSERPTYVTDAIYPELLKFERVYWALVALAADPDF